MASFHNFFMADVDGIINEVVLVSLNTTAWEVFNFFFKPYLHFFEALYLHNSALNQMPTLEWQHGLNGNANMLMLGTMSTMFFILVLNTTAEDDVNAVSFGIWSLTEVLAV